MTSSPVKAERLGTDAPGISRAINVLRAGGLLGLPTETVYGLAADACNHQAVAAIFAAKGRPQFNPLIVHVPDVEAAREIGELPAGAGRLAAAFWPGPLTLVVPRRLGALSDLVTAGLDTVAIRAPAHPVAQQVLRAFGGPVAAPSANPSGKISPTTADHVLDGLGDVIDAVVDAGPCDVGLESTIVGFADGLVLLRPGGLPVEAIEACVGARVVRRAESDAITAPGQLGSHYAPEAAVRLNAEGAKPGELLLGFGPGEADLNLSPAGDLTEAAANLFAHLRTLDARGSGKIAVRPIPDHGLGRAINDRLRRAAAPR